MGRAARALAAGALSAGMAALLALWWPGEIGVVLSPGERLDFAVQIGLGAGFVGAIAGSIGRPPVAIGALLPPAVLLALSVLPRHGRVAVHVDDGWLVVVATACLAAIALSRWRPRLVVLGVASFDLAVIGLSLPSAIRPPRAEGPDVFLLTLDTVRADHFDFCGPGSEPASTPFLSALAARSVVFTSAFAPVALTGPSHAVLLSGADPARTGVLVNGDAVPADLLWLPEIARRAGWATEAYVSAATLDASLGFARGFDRFDGAFDQRLERGHGLWTFRGHRRRAGSAHRRAGADTVDLVERTGHADGPRFTWVHLYDAHWPYRPSEGASLRAGLADGTPLPAGNLLDEVLGRRSMTREEVDRGRALYRATIDDLDGLAARLLSRVDPGAIVVVAGDHGESLGEHDYLFDHGRLPYAPDTRVPLLVRAPGLEPGRVDEVVGLDRVAPAVLGLMGLPVPAEMRGGSLLDRDARVVISEVFVSGERTGAAVRLGGESVVFTAEGGWERFERARDPAEMRPESGPSRLSFALLDRLGEPARKAAGGPEMDEMLEALGYR